MRPATFQVPEHLRVDRKRAWGFTLIETMVVVAIIGVLAAIALPALQRFVVQARVNGITSDFLTSIGYARNEAISRSTRVVLCARQSPTNDTCITSDQYWGKRGWLIFVDRNYNDLMDAGDELVRIYDPVDSTGNNYGLVNTGQPKFIRFNADGTTGHAGGKFDVLVGLANGPWPERSICISITGRARAIDYLGGTICQ